MTTPVKFPLAKLLREKGFDEEVLFYYSDSVLKQHPLNKLYNWNLDNPPLNQFSAPTISEVVMWLYKKHGVWISVEPPFPKRIVLWEYYIQKSEDRSLLGQNSGYSSPTEAYKAAIEYVLTHPTILNHDASK